MGYAYYRIAMTINIMVTGDCISRLATFRIPDPTTK